MVRIGIAETTQCPFIIRAESVLNIVFRSQVLADHECLMAYQHSVCERSECKSSRRGQMSRLYKLSFEIYYICISVDYVGSIRRCIGVSLQCVGSMKRIARIKE